MSPRKSLSVELTDRAWGSRAEGIGRAAVSLARRSLLEPLALVLLFEACNAGDFSGTLGNVGPRITLSGDRNNTVEYHSVEVGDYSSAFGANTFTEGVVEWELKTNYWHSVVGRPWGNTIYDVAVGASMTDELTNQLPLHGYYPMVSFLLLVKNGRRTRYTPTNLNNTGSDLWLGRGFLEPDALTVRLDIDRREISFAVDGEELGVSHTNLPANQTWRLGISFQVNASITVVSETQIMNDAETSLVPGVNSTRALWPRVWVYLALMLNFVFWWESTFKWLVGGDWDGDSDQEPKEPL